MNVRPLLSLLLLTSPILAQNANKPKSPIPTPPQQPQTNLPAETPEKKIDLAPNQQAFLNLPEETRKEFFKSLSEATRLFNEKRIFETQEEIHKGMEIFADSSEFLNLRGSCYVEIRNFEKALEDFNKALVLSPNNPSIIFNIGEMYFCMHQWQKCIDTFSKVIKTLPKEQAALTQLIEFKILLSYQKLGNKPEVTKLQNKYTESDDSPYYYYSQAAIAYESKNLVKAEEWLARANRIFRNPAILSPWQDTMVEYGYIKSFYGHSEGSDE